MDVNNIGRLKRFFLKKTIKYAVAGWDLRHKLDDYDGIPNIDFRFSIYLFFYMSIRHQCGSTSGGFEFG